MKCSVETITGECRLDVWLWAARIYKTRNLAATKIKGGSVSVSGKTKTKPASQIKKGDKLLINLETSSRTLIVEELAVKRVSFEKAKRLYTTVSITLNETEGFFQRRKKYKPDKKERRELMLLKNKLNY